MYYRFGSYGYSLEVGESKALGICTDPFIVSRCTWFMLRRNSAVNRLLGYNMTCRRIYVGNTYGCGYKLGNTIVVTPENQSGNPFVDDALNDLNYYERQLEREDCSKCGSAFVPSIWPW